MGRRLLHKGWLKDILQQLLFIRMTFTRSNLQQCLSASWQVCSDTFCNQNPLSNLCTQVCLTKTRTRQAVALVLALTLVLAFVQLVVLSHFPWKLGCEFLGPAYSSADECLHRPLPSWFASCMVQSGPVPVLV